MCACSSNRVQHAKTLLAGAMAGLVLVGCARTPGFIPDRSGAASYYESDLRFHDTSEALADAFSSVKRVQTRVEYRTYVFAPESALQEDDIGLPGTLDRAVAVRTSSSERAATGVVVSGRPGQPILLTVAHAVAFPDTVLRYFESDVPGLPAPGGPSAPRFIESVSVKVNQTNWVWDPPYLDPFEVLVQDQVLDLALVSLTETDAPGPGRSFSELVLVGGDSGRLTWGTVVHVLGYPRGYPMVTRGLVSADSPFTPDAYLVDGVWSPGMSGGPILASRGDGDGFEWVGVARGAAGSVEARLIPEPEALERYDLDAPYGGELFLEEFRRIDYGLNFATPISDVRTFIEAHRQPLATDGYELARF